MAKIEYDYHIKFLPLANCKCAVSDVLLWNGNEKDEDKERWLMLTNNTSVLNGGRYHGGRTSLLKSATGNL